MKEFMCYDITGERTLVAGEVNTASPVCFTVEVTCALVV